MMTQHIDVVPFHFFFLLLRKLVYISENVRSNQSNGFSNPISRIRKTFYAYRISSRLSSKQHDRICVAIGNEEDPSHTEPSSALFQTREQRERYSRIEECNDKIDFILTISPAVPEKMPQTANQIMEKMQKKKKIELGKI